MRESMPMTRVGEQTSGLDLEQIGAISIWTAGEALRAVRQRSVRDATA